MAFILPYIRLLGGLLLLFGASQFAPEIFQLFSLNPEFEVLIVFFVIALLGSLSFLVHYMSTGTVLPSFVIAIFFGIVGQPLLVPVVHHTEVMGALVSFGATLILFGGGLEIPFKQFKRLFGKILSLSFVGLFVTSVSFAYVLMALGGFFHVEIPIMEAVLLGAILASTDPAAIIPVLKTLRFKRRACKDIVVSESAITDVIGTLLTMVFLTMVLSKGAIPQDIAAAYAQLFQGDSMMLLGKQVLFGVVFGILGWLLLEVLLRFKRKHIKENEVDAAYFMCVPVVAYVAALALGGSGYLAAFVAGLLIMVTEHLYETERFFNHMIDGFLKPTIFLLLGALVDFHTLIEFMPIGVSMAVLFMFVIRPLAVLIALGPFTVLSKSRLRWRELVFISWVRETGAIPAVLLVTIVSFGIQGFEGLVPLGMWVILLTLIIQPPLTPWLAKKLDVAIPIEDDGDMALQGEAGDPIVVIASRGYSYGKRLPFVMEWASTHNVRHVVLLCCPEGRYSEELREYVDKHAMNIVEKKNAEMAEEGKRVIDFHTVIRKGFLQDNIEELVQEQSRVITTLFVGRRVLDYRLPQIKRLSVPLYFVE